MCVLVGCTTNDSPVSANTLPIGMVFLDLDSSDRKISKAMSDKKESIELTFGGREVTTVNIPERLQNWLSAAEDSGRGIEVRDTNGVQTKSLGAILALIPAGIKLARDAYQSRLIKRYKANIYLVPETGVIEKIVFER